MGELLDREYFQFEDVQSRRIGFNERFGFFQIGRIQEREEAGFFSCLIQNVGQRALSDQLPGFGSQLSREVLDHLIAGCVLLPATNKHEKHSFTCWIVRRIWRVVAEVL
jgi:hypothetical protein